MALPATTHTGEKTVQSASSVEAEHLNMGMNIALEYLVSIAFRSVLQLGVPDILVKAPGPMTVEQIISQLNCKSPIEAAIHLKRCLAFLVRKGVFSESSDGKFDLTGFGEMFATDHPFTLLPLANMLHHNAFIDSSKCLPGLILNDTLPFETAVGAGIFAHDNPHYSGWASIFNRGMVSHTVIVAGRVASEYPGFSDVKSIVDVGGGYGTAVGILVAAHPHLQGINFDLPHVVASAPSLPGVKHVGGDFFQSIPSADMVFLKGILHDHGDERCVQILKNCHEALPTNGKVVISETLLTAENSSKIDATVKLDLLLMTACEKGRERTLQQYTDLLLRAGFSLPTFVKKLEASDILEANKI